MYGLMRMNSNVTYVWTWAIVANTIQVRSVDIESRGCVEAEGLWEISETSFQFCGYLT